MNLNSESFGRRISEFRRALREANDGSICLHPGDMCNRVLINAGRHYPVVENRYGEPFRRWDVAMACLCNCPPCTAFREARHRVMGAGDLMGLVSSEMAAHWNARTLELAERRGWCRHTPSMAEQVDAYAEDLAELLVADSE